jgi:hypothetical protein
MINPFTDVNWNPDRQARKKFAFSLVIGFPAIAIMFSAVAFLKTHSLNHSFVWLGAIGFAVGLVLWLLPQIAKPFYVVWYFLACCMGMVIGNLLFALLFYLVFTPLGLLLRLRKDRPIKKGFDKSQKSYWCDVEKPADAERYFRQF